jgi:hypothetical protein
VAKWSTRPRACWPGARAQLRRTGFHQQAATRIVGRPKTACTCTAHLASSSFRPCIVAAKTILLFVPLDGVIPSRHRISSLRWPVYGYDYESCYVRQADGAAGGPNGAHQFRLLLIGKQRALGRLCRRAGGRDAPAQPKSPPSLFLPWPFIEVIKPTTIASIPFKISKRRGATPRRSRRSGGSRVPLATERRPLVLVAGGASLGRR